MDVRPMGRDVGVRETEESRMMPAVVTCKLQKHGRTNLDEKACGEINSSICIA